MMLEQIYLDWLCIEWTLETFLSGHESMPL